jgi:RNA polymerase sigma factor (sigma-70 family)
MPHLTAVTDEHQATALENVGLIAYTLRYFRVPTNSDYTFDDAMQDGWFGLVKAVAKHDPSKGSLSNYAMSHIRRQVDLGRARAAEQVMRSDIRRGRPFVAGRRPLSIDRENSSSDSRRIIDELQSTDSTDDEAVSSALVSSMIERGRAVCRNAVDTDILESLIRPERKTVLRSEIGRRHGLTVDAVRAREKTLLVRLAAVLSDGLASAA